MFREIHFRRLWRYIYINSNNFAKLPQRSYNVYTKIRCTPLTALRKYDRYLSTDKSVEHIVDSVLDQSTYEKVCAITLDGLNEYLERLIETVDYLPGSDIGYSDGVLTVNLGPKHGVYVINRQTPNKQIWLSSPFSGPKRYDFVGPKTGEKGKWLYRHDDETLHDLLQQELQPIFKDQKLDFSELPYSS
uniref:ferroxidase n=1 Tax=Glossina pallidipes TaxID=7398 RepID=A0A1A9Z9R1_GLOPL